MGAATKRPAHKAGQWPGKGPQESKSPTHCAAGRKENKVITYFPIIALLCWLALFTNGTQAPAGFFKLLFAPLTLTLMTTLGGVVWLSSLGSKRIYFQIEDF